MCKKCERGYFLFICFVLSCFRQWPLSDSVTLTMKGIEYRELLHIYFDIVQYP